MLYQLYTIIEIHLALHIQVALYMIKSKTSHNLHKVKVKYGAVANKFNCALDRTIFSYRRNDYDHSIPAFLSAGIRLKGPSQHRLVGSFVWLSDDSRDFPFICNTDVDQFILGWKIISG
jgi:hypothetical protein